MAASTSWQATLYGASNDPATTGYTTELAATVAGYSGAVSKAFYILQPKATWAVTGEPLEDVSGWIDGTNEARRQFEIISYPFYYNNAGAQDLDDIDALVAVITKRFKWIRIQGGSRSWPSTADTVHPIVVVGFDEAIDAQFGTRTITLTCQLRGRA